MWIEIFRTGKHTDSSGRSGEFPPERLDRIASTYNSRILEEPTMLAPVVKGHPKDDAPAFGWVKRLARRGDRLVAFVDDIAKDFAKEVRQGKFKRVSVALYPDLMLKHIGFLGAAAPAVKGLAEASFTEEEGIVAYSFSDFYLDEDDTHLLQEENEALKREIDVIRKEKRLREFREYANALIADENGAKILPSQAADLVDLLELAFRMDKNLEHSDTADSKTTAVKHVKNFVENLKPVFNVNEFAEHKNRVHHTDFEQEHKNVNPERLRIHEKAIEFLDSTPGLSYEEAVIAAQKELF